MQVNLPEDRPDVRAEAAADEVDGAPADRSGPEPTSVFEPPVPTTGAPAAPPTVEPGARPTLAAGPDEDQAATALQIAPTRLPLVLALAAVIVVLDQITKAIAVGTLTPGISPKILGGVVYFSLLRNPGAAFSFATGMTWILALVAIAVAVAIVRISARLRSGWWATSLGLILGGAVGNLIDRFFRSPGFLRGHVVDFVSVFGPDARYFPVFNVADSGITIGAIMLVLTSLRGIELDGTRTAGSRSKEQHA